MLYIVTALYEEALPFIQRYHLKRKTDFAHFELFTGEDVRLLVTRPGALRAAAALSSLLTAFPPEKQDFLLSAGCAGCAQEELKGNAFLICRITEGSCGRTRYPELLYQCPFPLAEVVTQAAVQQKAPGVQAFSTESLPVLYDMEAAGIYEAAIPYFSCDRLLFVKVVSDALTGLLELPEPMRRTHVIHCIEGIVPPLTDWVDGLCAHAAQEGNSGNISLSAPCDTKDTRALGMEGSILYAQVCNALRLSVTSSQHLYQLMLYLTLSEIPYLDSMKKLLAAPLAQPCRAKKEGLKYLEQLNEYYL